MCLAVPGQVLSIAGDDRLTRTARVAFAGIVKEVGLALLPQTQVGDYVLVHAGFAIAVVDEQEAIRTLEYFAALTELDRGSEPAP